MVSIWYAYGIDTISIWYAYGIGEIEIEIEIDEEKKKDTDAKGDADEEASVRIRLNILWYNCHMEIKAVEITAELRQIKSMVDGTYNITINVPEYCLEQVKVMMGWLKREINCIIQSDD